MGAGGEGGGGDQQGVVGGGGGGKDKLPACQEVPADGGQREAGVGVADVCFFLTMRCFNDAMFSNS